MASNPVNYGFEIPPQGLQELAEVAQNAKRLPEVQSAISALPLHASEDDVRATVAKSLDTDPNKAELLLRGLTSLRSLATATKLPPADLFDAITASLQTHADWNKKNYSQWTDGRDQIIAEISSARTDDALSLLAKVRELAYLRDNILISCRLLTELRPVYNTAADKMLTTVLTTSLLIRHRSGGRVQETQFEMDLQDISGLRSQCERAERKIATAERQYRDAALNLTVIGRGNKEAAG